MTKEIKRLNSVSKFMSLILRHKPETIGIKLDNHGWANVDELINGMCSHGTSIDIPMLEKIVEIDNKKRYSFNNDKTKIRANQGHSIAVDVELQEIKPPEYLYHGTATKYEDSIDKNGLIPKSRLYVHLSSDVDTARKVGSRHGDPVIYTVQTGLMYNDGHTFYKSVNGVWLTDNVPVKYLMKKKGIE